MGLLIVFDAWGELRGQMSGHPALRDHRDATGSIWLFLGVCPWLWSLCSFALIWEVPANGGLFVLNLGPLAFSEALCLVMGPIETFEPLNVTHRTWPEALPQAYLRLESEVKYAWKECLEKFKSNILIQMFLLACPSFPTFLASGLHLKRRNMKTRYFDITSYNGLNLLTSNQCRNWTLPYLL